MARLTFIRDAQAAGPPLAEICDVLAIRDAGLAPCQHVTDLIDQHLTDIEEHITELTQARTALQCLKRRAAATDPDECTRTDICTILTEARPGAAPPEAPRRAR